MEELRAVVEKGGVEFVPLAHELPAGTETPGLPKVGGDATDEERGISTRIVEHVREQRRGGRLSVRASNDERAFSRQEQLGEQRRKGFERNATGAGGQHL